jgi:transketolase
MVLLKYQNSQDLKMVNRDNILDNLIPYFKDKRFMLLVTDMGFAKSDRITAMYPDRVINCGIMEQATVGIASGMAQAGLIPIIYSISAFIVLRALEQIRNDIVLADRNVKIIGNGCGDYFKGLGSCHWIKDDDIKLMDIIGMPVFEGSQFDEWVISRRGGYIRV